MCWKVLLKPRSQMLDMDKKRLFLMLASAPPPLNCESLLRVGKASGEAGVSCSSWKWPFVARMSWL